VDIVTIVVVTWVLSLVTTMAIVYFVGPSVTNVKLAPYSIPFVITGGKLVQQMSGGVWVGINDMETNITLERPSQLIITFSTEAMADPGHGLAVRVQLAGPGTYAFPDEIHMVPTAIVVPYPYQGVQLGYSSYSYTFFPDYSVAGTISIKVEGSVTFVEGMGGGGNAYLTHRTLTVIALPT